MTVTPDDPNLQPDEVPDSLPAEPNIDPEGKPVTDPKPGPEGS